MKNWVQEGRAIDVVATAAVTSGSGQLVGTMFGVAGSDAAIGDTYALWLVGVYSLPKLGTDAPNQGDALYWDNANHRCTVTSTGNTKIGVAAAAAANGVATVNVRLNATF